MRAHFKTQEHLPMDYTSRRAPLKKGRRINLNLNIAPDVHRELGRLCGGNRSAAVEALVHEHLARVRVPQPDTVA